MVLPSFLPFPLFYMPSHSPSSSTTFPPCLPSFYIYIYMYISLSLHFIILFFSLSPPFCLISLLLSPLFSVVFFLILSRVTLSTSLYISLCTFLFFFHSLSNLPLHLHPFPPTLPPFRLSLPSSHIYISIKFCESSRNSPPPGCLSMPAVARTESNHTLDKLP